MYSKLLIIFSCLVGVEATVVIAGWIFGIDVLTRLSSQRINMSFPSAVMFFLSAIGLYLIYREVEKENAISQVVLPAISLFIFLIIITILAGLFVGVQTGIENLFIQKQQFQLLNNTIAGLPSIPSLIGFALFGLASISSLIFGAKSKTSIEFFGYVISLIGLIAVVGYAIEQPLLYYKFTASSTPIALNTTLTFVILGFGLAIVGRNKTTNET